MGKKFWTFLAWVFGIAAIALIVVYSLVIAVSQLWFLAIAAGAAALCIWFAALAFKAKRHEDERRREKEEKQQE